MGTWEVKTPQDYANALNALQAKFDRIAEEVQVTTEQAVADVLIECHSEAVQRAPVDTGTLRGSAYVALGGEMILPPEPRPKTAYSQTRKKIVTVPPPLWEASASDTESAPGIITGEVGFPEKYAFVQHEHAGFDHPRGGQDHYLSSVVAENADKWLQQLKDAAIRAIRGE